MVIAEDFKFYAAKTGTSRELLFEHIGSSFARLWNIPVPDSAWIKFKPQHVPPGMIKSKFETPIYGSKYLEYAMDINDTFQTWKERSYDIRKIHNSADLLKIGLFDLWLSNEDRNHNNLNLLLNPENHHLIFYVIDHVNLLNTNTLEHGLNVLTEEENILTAGITKLIFKGKPGLGAISEDILRNFYLYRELCIENLSKILQSVPHEFQVDLSEFQSQLTLQLNDPRWILDCSNAFREYIAMHLQNN